MFCWPLERPRKTLLSSSCLNDTVSSWRTMILRKNFSNAVSLNLFKRGVCGPSKADKFAIESSCSFLLLYYMYPLGMRHHGIVFVGSWCQLETYGVLKTSLGYALWFGQFTPVKQVHLVCVQVLLHTLCSLGIFSPLQVYTLHILQGCYIHTSLRTIFIHAIYT